MPKLVEIGRPEQADPLCARVEAMSYDELVEYLGVEFDLAIAST